jgi:putative flippase GtrA
MEGYHPVNAAEVTADAAVGTLSNDMVMGNRVSDGRLVALARRFGVERHLPLLTQFVSFGVVGGFVTLVNVAIYWLGAQKLAVDPNRAWCVGFVVALAVGYLLQSRFVFRPAEGVSRPVAAVRYVLVALIGFAINSFWVWAMVTHAGMPTWAPIPLVVFLTPLFSFFLNRLWVFR